MSLTTEQREQIVAEAEEKRISHLEDLVRKEADVSLKRSRTNGRNCLHISSMARAGWPGDFKPWKGSYTIYTEDEWERHPWNSENKRERRENREVTEAVKNR